MEVNCVDQRKTVMFRAGGVLGQVVPQFRANVYEPSAVRRSFLAGLDKNSSPINIYSMAPAVTTITSH
jgi:hypothetical protein